MSADRLSPPAGIGEMIRQAEERGRAEQREKDAEIAQWYPVETWAEDSADAKRVAFDISQAIRKGLKPTELLP